MQQKIIYIQYTNPAGYPPLQHSSHILAESGWDIMFLGTDASTHRLRFTPHPRIQVRYLRYVLPGWRQKLQFLFFIAWAIAWMLRWRPQVVYISDLLACPVGILVSYLPHVKVFYHEHDSPVFADNIKQSAFIKWALKSRRQLGKRAKLCIFPNQQRAQYFAKTIADHSPIMTVWNCPSKHEVCPPKMPLSLPLKLYYHGNISEDLLPSEILEAVARLHGKVHLRVVGYTTLGTETYLTQLKQKAIDLQIEQYIEFMAAVPRPKLLQLASECHVGLALLPQKADNINFQFMIGASNKPFDYLAAGLALLVSNAPDWCQLYVESGYALTCDRSDAASIADALQWFIAHPDDCYQMGQKGQQRILNDWNYEQQFMSVVKVLDSTI